MSVSAATTAMNVQSLCTVRILWNRVQPDRAADAAYGAVRAQPRVLALRFADGEHHLADRAPAGRLHVRIERQRADAVAVEARVREDRGVQLGDLHLPHGAGEAERVLSP